MTDGYWNRQQAMQQAAMQQATMQPAMLPSSAVLKRPRTEYEMSTSGLASGNEMQGYVAREDDRSGSLAIKDTKTILSAYDRYLQSAQMPSYNSGEASTIGSVGMARPVVSTMPGHSLADPSVMRRPGSGGHDLAPNGRNVNFSGQLPVDTVPRPGPETVPLPPDASSTLYVEGLPPDSTRREVAHIFRPFVGYREVRLVTKESKTRSGEPLILCFVDFANPACAATALSALQGYKVDELNAESSHLRLQFSRFPGPRTGPGSRGKR